MKKLFISILALVTALGLCACEHNLINNTDTGEITVSPKKYSYTDGVYCACYDYVGEDGYFAAAKAEINDGIITGVRFDYFDAYGNAFSEQDTEETADEITRFRATRKNLYNETISSQTADSGSIFGQDSYTADYNNLMKAILKNAEQGKKDIIYLKSSATFAESISITEDIRANLQITYMSDEIKHINFDITDKYYASLLNDEKICGELFALTPEVIKNTVMPLLTDISAEKKQNTEKAYETLFGVYNSLADKIITRHSPAGESVNELF